VGILFVVLVIAFVGAIATEPWRERRDAVAFIRCHAGSVTFDRTGNRADTCAERLACWAQRVFGNEDALPLTAIDFNGTNISDDQFAELMKYKRGLSGVRQLDISFTNLTDLSLGKLKALSGIEVVLIGNTTTTDDGLRFLQGMPKLRYIGLSRQHITTRGLEHLSGVRGLRMVDLDYTAVHLSDVVAEALPNVSITH
jgi:hypothetical protein